MDSTGISLATVAHDGCVSSEIAGAEPPTGNYFVSTYPPFSAWSADQIPSVTQRLEAVADWSQNASLGLYVHIPFCIRRCNYCYYLSYANRSSDDMDDYIDCLLQEFALYCASPFLGQRELNFIYFGGGTPSLLSQHQLARLLHGLQTLCPWSRVEEATFECAPQSVTEPKLRLLRDMGITRISLGIQDLNDEVLRLSGRVHLVEDVIRANDAIRQVGFDVVNLDVIAGLSGQTDASFLSSIERIIEMRPDCVTVYPLEIPHNTPLYRQLQEEETSEARPASWDIKRARLATGFERMEAAGYTRRSAYAAVKDPRRHRFIYQDRQYHGADLLGIGASAFSYLGGVHSQNISSLKEYSTRIQDRSLPLSRAYALTDEERLIREFILQLKLGSADAEYFKTKFNSDIRVRFADPLGRLHANGWIDLDHRGVQMTRQGLSCVDRLLIAFYLPRHRGIRYA